MTATKRALKQARLGDNTGCVCMPSGGELLLRYTSSNLGTRQGKIQVALVKVLNNIVKHAYGDQGGGIIEITCQPFVGYLGFEIVDAGIALTDHCLQNDQLSAVNIQASLPEGGFG